MFSILVGVGSLGLVAFAFLKVLDQPVDDSDQSNKEKFISSMKTVLQAIKYCGKVLFVSYEQKTIGPSMWKKPNLSLLNFFLGFFSPSNLDFFFLKKKQISKFVFFYFRKKNQIWIWSFSLMNLDFFWRKLFLIHIWSVFFRKNPNS